MGMVISNNDGRLYIFIEGKWRKIPTIDFEITTDFDVNEYNVSGEIYARTFVGQGTLSGSFKTPWVVANGTPEELIVSKYLEKLRVPRNQCVLNNHKIKVINLMPSCTTDGKEIPYTEIEFTASLAPSEPLVGSDLSEQTFLGFDIGFQGNMIIRSDSELGENLTKVKVNVSTTSETKKNNIVTIGGIKMIGYSLVGNVKKFDPTSLLVVYMKDLKTQKTVGIVAVGNNTYKVSEAIGYNVDDLVESVKIVQVDMTKNEIVLPTLKLNAIYNKQPLTVHAVNVTLNDINKYDVNTLEVEIVDVVDTKNNQYTPNAA